MQQQLNFITCLTILVQITDQKATIDGKKFENSLKGYSIHYDVVKSKFIEKQCMLE